MKVFVVIGSFRYCGYCEPVGVYDTYELALATRDEAKGYDDVEIFEYTMNVAEGFLI